VIERVDMSAPDEPFATLLARQMDVDAKTKAMLTDYVEGFNAADASRISVQALVKEEQAETSHATSRITTGYRELMHAILSQAQAHGVVLHLNTIAKKVRWRPQHVEVDCITAEGYKTFSANAAVVTLPLGIVQEGGAGGVLFEPKLPEKDQAAARLEMGNVVKITLQFSSRFWPIENFGFIHDPGQTFPTWWSDERGPILTGWVGGRRAAPLLQQTPDMILMQALETLGRIFPVKESDIRERLESSYYHNWAQDPYSLGAYSYVPAGSSGVPEELARPVADTLFFAGEATAPDGQQGTVGAAIATGRRAARQCLEL
jgi:monoamine oxidase